MYVSRLFAPVLALAAAAGATLYTRSLIEGQRQLAAQGLTVAAPAPTKSVLVAAKALSVGQFIQSGDVRWQQWPDVAVPEGYLVEGQKGPEEVVGAVLRRPAGGGEPIVLDNVVKPGDRGFLAAVLDPDMRAVSVPVDEASSNAGLIFPGDRVDLILTQTLSDATKEAAPTRRVSETVLQDVRVLAMGRRLNPDDDEKKSGNNQIRTTTLEVTAAAAEKVALVTELGKLSLSLRSLARREPGPERPPAFRATWDADVSPVLRPENQPRTNLAVIRGTEAQAVAVRKGVTQ